MFPPPILRSGFLYPASQSTHRPGAIPGFYRQGMKPSGSFTFPDPLLLLGSSEVLGSSLKPRCHSWGCCVSWGMARTRWPRGTRARGSSEPTSLCVEGWSQRPSFQPSVLPGLYNYVPVQTSELSMWTCLHLFRKLELYCF